MTMKKNQSNNSRSEERRSVRLLSTKEVYEGHSEQVLEEENVFNANRSLDRPCVSSPDETNFLVRGTPYCLVHLVAKEDSPKLYCIEGDIISFEVFLDFTYLNNYLPYY